MSSHLSVVKILLELAHRDIAVAGVSKGQFPPLTLNKRTILLILL